MLSRVKCIRPLTSAKRFYSKSELLTTPKYPGAVNAKFTKDLVFHNAVPNEPVFPIFHIMDLQGKIINQSSYKSVRETLDDDTLVKMYKTMIQLETMDTILYNAQRQGRVSFYMTNYGEEAVQIGSAAALTETDEIFAQYREAGVLMYRGFTLEEFMNQCFSTSKDYGKGRQMPVHYGSKSLRVQTISSPLATQIPQASGAGYAIRLSDRKDVAICYFGEGAASEGDFHSALNFAAVLKSQVIFLCRNNGYAISTPTSDQYKGDGIVARGLGYGIHSIRVDGNDPFAVYMAVREARKMSTEKHVPVLIEAMTYRGGHHSTSDDASRYRTTNELTYWREQMNPIFRLKKFLTNEKLWNEENENQVRDDTRKKVLSLLTSVEKAEKTHLDELVTDVYDQVPETLKEQKKFVDAMAKKYPEAYSEGH
ncbi:2-oxoisovalerate dehydrogenase E1 component subunit alpha [Acrasis kona]|uniref:2-oxoisovalerate dehydrogenase subunit alpha n=1 Tax=Acrasis kona TaxID=1008807 RepID=A0AAW2ZQT8_9EUKA